MQLIEWGVNEDGYEEQIIIPNKQRDLAAEEGIGMENKQKHHYPLNWESRWDCRKVTKNRKRLQFGGLR